MSLSDLSCHCWFGDPSLNPVREKQSQSPIFSWRVQTMILREVNHPKASWGWSYSSTKSEPPFEKNIQQKLARGQQKYYQPKQCNIMGKSLKLAYILWGTNYLLRMVMEPKYYAFWRWLCTPIILWQGDEFSNFLWICVVWFLEKRGYIPSLKLTARLREIGFPKKERVVFQPSIFQVRTVNYVSFREGNTSWYGKSPMIFRVSAPCQVVGNGISEPSTVGFMTTPPLAFGRSSPSHERSQGSTALHKRCRKNSLDLRRDSPQIFQLSHQKITKNFRYLKWRYWTL